MTKPVILTGVRSNENPTLGNYFGAILPLIDMAKRRSDEYSVNIFVPDLHSFTTPINHDQLFDQTIYNIKVFIASGFPLDNDQLRIYRQSFIPAHSEMTWILDCFTGVGEMQRMTQFKDKSTGLGDERTSIGLFNYPVLMAADILLYNAIYVPVGDDQSQHLEFTRDIAERMNNRFGDLFTIPEPVRKQHEFFGKGQGLRIMDLQNPTKKMSKSDESGKGVIFLRDDPELAVKKIMGATTDDLANITFDRQNQPGIANLLEILSLLRGTPLDQVVAEFEGQSGYGDFKKVVAAETRDFLIQFQAALAAIDDATVFTKLEVSERSMSEVANATLLRAQQAVGLRAKD
ncbi:tryptophan--tRNA ligase [bacterium]|nr:MAG: tryptophan--tRNA ligase [bacterium]